MKSLTARLAVLALAATGFAASTTLTAAASKKPHFTPAVVGVVGSAPMCMPSDPSHCGMQ